MATFLVKNGSAWLCFQFWVPKISLLFIPLGFIHQTKSPESQYFGQKSWFFLLLMRFMRIDAHLMRISNHRRMANPKNYPSLATTSYNTTAQYGSEKYDYNIVLRVWMKNWKEWHLLAQVLLAGLESQLFFRIIVDLWREKESCRDASLELLIKGDIKFDPPMSFTFTSWANRCGKCE